MNKKKMYLYVLLGLLSCSGMKAQTASDVQVIPVNFEQSTAYFTSLSDNGLWAVAVATDEENTGCNDCTDYVLPLEPGDRVSVVEETSRGFLVKHNGVSGWYGGELL